MPVDGLQNAFKKALKGIQKRVFYQVSKDFLTGLFKGIKCPFHYVLKAFKKLFLYFLNALRMPSKAL